MSLRYPIRPTSLLTVVALACGADLVIGLPYEGCSPGGSCAFGNVCLRATLSATGTGQGYQCAPSRCRSDQDCPSLDGRCVFGPPGGSVGQCYRSCTHRCRTGTACVVVSGYDGLCLPIGPDGPAQRVYQRCTSVGSACRDGTLCASSLTTSRETLSTCTFDDCAGDQDCPGYSVFAVICRQQSSATGLVRRCARGCRAESDCVGSGTTCVNGACE